MASFVVDMAKVFEDFVTVALREAAADRPGRIRSQFPLGLTEGGQLPMYPDVVHLVDGRPSAVFDAKYKIEGPRREVSNADIYQMLAYCTALQLSRGHLIYAEGEGTPVTHRIVNTDPAIEIEQHPLDLTTTPAQVLAQVRTLVARTMPARRTSGAKALATSRTR